MKIKELLSKAWWVVILPAIYFIVKLFTGNSYSADAKKGLKEVNKLNKEVANNKKVMQDTANALNKSIANSQSKKPTHSDNVKKILTDL